MSRMGAWVMEMTERARELDRDGFIHSYGVQNVNIWDTANGYVYQDVEQDLIDREFDSMEEIHHG